MTFSLCGNLPSTLGAKMNTVNIQVFIKHIFVIPDVWVCVFINLSQFVHTQYLPHSRLLGLSWYM